MKIQVFQHVPFEGLGLIEPWLRQHGHTIETTRFFAGDEPPKGEPYDWLIVMGGPMNVYQVRDYPWLWTEKRAIAKAIENRKRLLGVCLGAQLIADVLGAKVFQNDKREIGWFPIRGVRGKEALFTSLFAAEATVLHWHGDTFDLPPGTTWLAESTACKHQAFCAGPHILGLQFHAEMGREEINRIADGCENELIPEEWVQTREQLLAGADDAAASVQLLHGLLEVLAHN